MPDPNKKHVASDAQTNMTNPNMFHNQTKHTQKKPKQKIKTNKIIEITKDLTIPVAPDPAATTDSDNRVK